MDIQKALKLLDLEPGATLEDARAAFKEKAKRFHPDKLMAASKTCDDGEKMKEINVAYHTLKPLLTSGARKKGSRLLPACRHLVETVRKWISGRHIPSGAAPPVRPGTARPRNPSGTTLPPHQDPGAFEEVLRQSMHRRLDREKRYSAYVRYLELERKMKQARRKNSWDRTDAGSVEPVSRIKPVK